MIVWTTQLGATHLLEKMNQTTALSDPFLTIRWDDELQSIVKPRKVLCMLPEEKTGLTQPIPAAAIRSAGTSHARAHPWKELRILLTTG